MYRTTHDSWVQTLNDTGRLSDYKLIGAYSEITTFDPANPLKSEIEVGQAYFKKGFRAATLLTGYCRHLGQNRHCK
jgi:hypothetical protein